MLHPHTKLDFVDEQMGYGVVATRLIPAGTITWTLDRLDQRVPASEFERMPVTLQRVLEHYAFLDGHGTYILCWDFARYMNHSCQPTSLAPGIDVEIAVRDILPGEQITGDYGAYNLERDLPCRCGSANCRGTIKNADFHEFADHWDSELRRAVRRIADVSQPLWDHVADRELLLAAAVDPMQLPTCAGHRMASEPLRAAAHG